MSNAGGAVGQFGTGLVVAVGLEPAVGGAS